jgi:hypothetical protein
LCQEARGKGGREVKGGGGGKWREMTQTLYAHKNKIKIKKKENVVFIHNGILLRHEEEILSFPSKWMKLENNNLSEVRQAQKTKSHMFSLICGF